MLQVHCICLQNDVVPSSDAYLIAHERHQISIVNGLLQLLELHPHHFL